EKQRQRPGRWRAAGAQPGEPGRHQHRQGDRERVEEGDDRSNEPHLPQLCDFLTGRCPSVVTSPARWCKLARPRLTEGRPYDLSGSPGWVDPGNRAMATASFHALVVVREPEPSRRPLSCSQISLSLQNG